VQDVVSWSLDQYALIGATLALFGFLGFLRGVNRELRSMIGIGLGMLLASVMVPNMGKQINSLYKLGRFAVVTIDVDPETAWREVQMLPDLIQTSADLRFASLLVFCLVGLVFYLWGQGRSVAPPSLVSKVLGLVAGGINGFLVAYYAFPLLLPRSEAVITVPSGRINATLANSRSMALVAVFIVVILIALGLRSSRSPRL